MRNEILYHLIKDIYLYFKIIVSDYSYKNEFQFKFNDIQVDNQYSLIVSYLIDIREQVKDKNTSYFNFVLNLEKRSYDKLFYLSNIRRQKLV